MSKKHNRPSGDLSPIIPQREKIKDQFNIKEFPWTEKQKQLINLIEDNKTKLTLVSGPAGCSKSLVSVYCALRALNNRRIGEVIYTRPILESADSNSKIGYLPGDRELKTKPYLEVIEDKLDELLSFSDKKKLQEEDRINFLEVNYARGLNISAKYWIIDEAQGFTEKEMVTLITRIGQVSKVIICADPRQSDLPPTKRGAFEKLIKLFSDDISKENGIFTFEFTKDDILRSKLCKFIVEKLETSDIGKNGH